MEQRKKKKKNNKKQVCSSRLEHSILWLESVYTTSKGLLAVGIFISGYYRFYLYGVFS